MIDYQKYINALRKCAKEHDNDITYTGHIIVSDLCRDTANLLEELSSSEKPNKWNDVLDKIRAEIEEYSLLTRERVIGIIDKYREVKE